MKKFGSLLLCLSMIALSICSPLSSFLISAQAETIDTTLDTTSGEEIALTEEIVSAENVSCEETADGEPYVGSMEFMDTSIDESQLMAPPEEGTGIPGV